MKKVYVHIDLGITFYSKLSFSAHIKSAISRMRRGIGLLNYLSRYLSKHTLNNLYELYVRPFLDYGMLSYSSRSMRIQQQHHFAEFNGKIKSIRYSAALTLQ